MSAGHTPGPWKVSFDGAQVYSGTRTQWIIADCLPSDRADRSRYAANANLIAAAPMLLEGADDAVKAFKVLRIGLAGEPKALEVIDAHIDELEYAIATATGIPR